MDNSAGRSYERRLGAVLFAVGLVAAGLSACFHPKAPGWSWSWLAPGEISVKQAKGLPGVVWVDAREPADYAAAHAPGAVNLTETDWNDGLGRLLESWRPRAPLVVYCGSSGCATSARVATRLRGPECGFTEVYTLDGGWEAYARAR